MKNRIIFLILSILTILPLQAQLATGSWKQYPVHGEFSDLIDTGKGLWYVTGGCLYHYDSEADETRFYEGGKELTDYTVKFIRYYPGKDMLAVVFNNCNIDMLLADGTRVNMPDIKDATVNVEKTVNDIAFDGDEMFVATGFGLVIYDLNHFEVKESGIYNRDINTVMVTPQHIVLAPSAHVDWRYKLMAIKRGEPIHNYDKFKEIATYYNLIHHPEPLNDDHTQFATVRHNRVGSIHFNDDGTVASHSDNIDTSLQISRLSRSKDGTVRFLTSDGKMGHYIDKSSVKIDATLPEEFKGNMIAADKGLSSTWLADENGIGCYSIADDGGMTVLRDKSVPDDAITFNEVCNIFPSNNPSQFYIANLGMTQHHPVSTVDGFNIRLHLNRFSRNNIETINPKNIPAYTSPVINEQNKIGKYIMSPTQIAEDPDNMERLYIGSGGEGVYVVEGDELLLKVDGNNAPINKIAQYYWGTVCVSIDPDGNLWVGTRGGGAEHRLIMLPSEKRRQDPSTWKYDDWIIADYEYFLYHKDMKLLHCIHSNMMFGIDGEADRGFLAVNQRGTRGDISDDVAVVVNPIDQDGKEFKPLLWTCMAEDKRGHVWMGTTSGVISVTNPTKALDADFRINRIKVPRNDGSGLADYLLESDKVVAIAVDSSNRKWLGTEASGLYLVSEDGDEIISHFTTSNSPLPTNTITALYADPLSNSIFIGTLSGLYEYSSTSGPAKDDYSNVYAYPNPVTPDYSGWITIAGLMENSLVKIVDSSMNLVYQTTSEGGMAMWDGCNMGGGRVRSGVYYVLASSQQDASSAMSTSAGDVVAKILVVN